MGASKSHNLMGLHDLLQGYSFTFTGGLSDQWVAFMIRIRYVSCSYLEPENGGPQIFHDIIQSAQGNVRILPQIKLQ
jgi:hypothetical protein